MDRFLNNPKTQEFIQAIKENEGLTEKTQLIENQHIAKVLHVENQLLTKPCGERDSLVWVSLFLWFFVLSSYFIDK